MPATLDVTLAQTWIQGCNLSSAEIQTNSSNGMVRDGSLHLQAKGDAVWIAACQ